jgi:uncharacterized membrane protein YuzA (DUF378 family)
MTTAIHAIMVILLAVGAINWLLVAFKFNLVSVINSKVVERVIYVVIGVLALLLAGIMVDKTKSKKLVGQYSASLTKSIRNPKLSKALAVPIIVLVIIGCLVWGVIGVADYNVVEKLLGVGAGTKVVYVVVGIAGILFLLGYGGLVASLKKRA